MYYGNTWVPTALFGTMQIISFFIVAAILLALYLLSRAKKSEQKPQSPQSVSQKKESIKSASVALTGNEVVLNEIYLYNVSCQQ